MNGRKVEAAWNPTRSGAVATRSVCGAPNALNMARHLQSSFPSSALGPIPAELGPAICRLEASRLTCASSPLAQLTRSTHRSSRSLWADPGPGRDQLVVQRGAAGGGSWRFASSSARSSSRIAAQTVTPVMAATAIDSQKTRR